jgi:hypothetical protein
LGEHGRRVSGGDNEQQYGERVERGFPHGHVWPPAAARQIRHHIGHDEKREIFGGAGGAGLPPA